MVNVRPEAWVQRGMEILEQYLMFLSDFSEAGAVECCSGVLGAGR